MGRKTLVTQDMVDEAANHLLSEGIDPTLRNVRERVGSGSMATILKMLQDWKQKNRRSTSPSSIIGPKFIQYDFNRIRSFSSSSSFFTDGQKKTLHDLGSLDSIATHDSYLPSIHRKMLLEASWASSALEGNTYSLIDTQELFERGIEMTGAKFEETQMLLNHKHAIEYVLGNVSDIQLARRDIMNIHALLSDGLMKNPSEVGSLRIKPVRIGRSAYVPPDVPSIISEEFDTLLQVAREIKDPFDQSFYLLANIAYLQAFSDVNKRTSRMASNIPLLKERLLPMSFYQMSKSSYEAAIVKYYESGDPRMFVEEYVDCYAVSAQRFKSMIESKPSDSEQKSRLLLRQEIAQTVRTVVKDGVDLAVAIGAVSSNGITQHDRKFLFDYVPKVIDGLNEGNLFLYKLTDEDLQSYRDSGSSSLPQQIF